jgi:hypothetical protein
MKKKELNFFKIFFKGFCMVSFYLATLSKEECKDILHTVVYMIYRHTPLTPQMQYFINTLGKLKDFDDEDFDDIYFLDARDELNYHEKIEKLDLYANKILLFFLLVFAQIFDEIELDKYYKKEELFDYLPFDDEKIKELDELVEEYLKITFRLHNYIYGKSAFSKEEKYKKFFLLDFEKLDELNYKQKESFLSNLALLMYEDKNIDSIEDSILELWEDILGVELDSSFLSSNTKVNIEKIKQELQEPWLVKFFIFSYIVSQKNKNSYHLIDTIDSSKFSFFKSLFFDIKELLSEYKDINIKLLKNFHSSSISYHNENFASTAEVLVNSMDVLVLFVPINKFTKIYTLVNTFRKGGEVYNVYTRDKKKLISLVDIKNANLDEIIICINGYLNEDNPNQFTEWGEALLKLQTQATIKGFTWISTNLKNALSSGVATWYQAVKNSFIVAKELLLEIEKIYLQNPNAKITLMGHSLGARVIFNTLYHAVEKDIKINSVYLFGGAVPRKEKAKWLNISSLVNNKIYNFYSKHDLVLKNLYQGAMFGESPIGLGEILVYKTKDYKNNIINIDVSSFVKGHSEYKKNIPSIFKTHNIAL